MFLTGNISLNIYTDAAQTVSPLLNIPSIDQDFQNLALTGVQPTVISLAALGSQVISFNGLTSVKRFFIYSDAANINVNMNGLGNVLMQYGEPGYLPGTLTSLTVTNTSSTLATNVTVILIAG